MAKLNILQVTNKKNNIIATVLKSFESKNINKTVLATNKNNCFLACNRLFYQFFYNNGKQTYKQKGGKNSF